MTITIELPAETERKLLARAAASGQDVTTLVVEAVEEKLRTAQPTFDEVLAPIRQGFAESGLSDEDVDQLFEQTLAEVRAEKRKARP